MIFKTLILMDSGVSYFKLSMSLIIFTGFLSTLRKWTFSGGKTVSHISSSKVVPGVRRLEDILGEYPRHTGSGIFSALIGRQ